MNLEPVIFLNFDDALAIHKFSDNARVLDVNAVAIVDAFPDLWLDVLDSTARRNLETLHKEFQPRYVISSSWASHLNLEGMQTMLKRCGLKFGIPPLARTLSIGMMFLSEVLHGT